MRVRVNEKSEMRGVEEVTNNKFQENICTIFLFLRNTPEFQLVAQKAQTMLQVCLLSFSFFISFFLL